MESVGCWVKWLEVKRGADPQQSHWSHWRQGKGYPSSALWLVLCVYSLIGSSEQSHEVALLCIVYEWGQSLREVNRLTPSYTASKKKNSRRAWVTPNPFFLQYLSAPEAPPEPDSSGCCRTSSWLLFIKGESSDKELKQRGSWVLSGDRGRGKGNQQWGTNSSWGPQVSFHFLLHLSGVNFITDRHCWETGILYTEKAEGLWMFPGEHVY